MHGSRRRAPRVPFRSGQGVRDSAVDFSVGWRLLGSEKLTDDHFGEDDFGVDRVTRVLVYVGAPEDGPVPGGVGNSRELLGIVVMP